jgi:thymidylate synthase ThyX
MQRTVTGRLLLAIIAKVIADSISPYGNRLTTMEWTYPRFIHSEVMTHRKFSRNSASSRAIPVSKVITQILENPAMPIRFTQEQPGMVGGADLHKYDVRVAQEIWLGAAVSAVSHADRLLKLNVHKSVVNRILEPFMWHTIIVSSTEWENFFSQRISPDAQPEINDLAEKANEALRASVPQRVEAGGWHLPYLTEEEKTMGVAGFASTDEILRRLSVARVAGVSYNRLGKTREIEKDLVLYDRLFNAKPPHWSPFEHVATPTISRDYYPGNFDGWLQLRHILDEQ